MVERKEVVTLTSFSRGPGALETMIVIHLDIPEGGEWSCPTHLRELRELLEVMNGTPWGIRRNMKTGLYMLQFGDILDKDDHD
jgi:hypothetical protein